jgi:hypothetical protein
MPIKQGVTTLIVAPSFFIPNVVVGFFRIARKRT